MEKVIESLTAMGYSTKEALAYVALLQLGRGTAYAIAEKSGLKKPTAHIILGELLKKGAVISIPGAKKKIFAARQPEDLFMKAEERLNQAKKSLPALHSIIDENASEFKTLYFEGIRGLKEALEYKADSADKKLLGFYALDKNLPSETLKVLDTWLNRVKKSGMQMKGFTPEHTSTEKYISLDSSREIRSLPLHKYSSEISIETQDTFVRIIDMKNLQSVIIDNPHIAKTMKQVFELVWDEYKHE